MSTAIVLDEQHFDVAVAKARELGTTPEAYVQSLIDAATLSFDEILAPVRESFRQGGATEDELDASVTEARKAIHASRDRK